MNHADAVKILGRLKAAFPARTLDEDQAELLLREFALLHDPVVLDEAVDHLIRGEEWFPSIAKIRLEYRLVVEAHRAARAALRAAEPDGDGRGIPEWVHVWEWHRRRTLSERQKANTSTNWPADKRPPVRMRSFPQLAHLSSPAELADAYTWEDYEQLRQEWVAAGSPSIGSALELAGAVA